ncbi:MAG TPA: DUF3352 domain-containing protein [Solirubrobacterales bacterium]|nr:DUF3352 domain-containing protein [Solirubrobacterales bacterium]
MKLRLVPFLLLAALAALFVAGCGGGSDDGGSGTDPASVAPAGVPVFIDATVRPEGETKTNIEALAKKIADVDDLGELIVEELESSASDDDVGLDFDKEVDPWLGDEAGIFLQEYEDEDFEGYGVAIQTNDEGATQSFIDKQAEDSEDEESGSYEGVDFEVGESETTVGVFDGLLVIAEDEAVFKEMVDASKGENLAGDEAYTSATANVPSESAADVFVDVGALIEQAGGEIDAESQVFLDTLGIDPDEATAVASVVPGSDYAEIDFSSNLSSVEAPSGDASELLGSLPGTAVGAFAAAEFGERFNEGIDQIDKKGIPGSVPPNQLKKTLKEAGIDLEAIAGSIGDVGLYVTGNSEKTLAGALILEAESDSEAQNTVSNIGLFLRKAGISGVTKIDGEASGFSIRSPELGRQPVVVVAKGSRIAVGYGLASVGSAFQEAGKTLSDNAAYKDATSALGSTPITAFVNGTSALNLAAALIPAGDEGFAEAKPYLQKIEYLALGSEASGDLATAKLIVGLK